jgi:hypothetical protein
MFRLCVAGTSSGAAFTSPIDPHESDPRGRGSPVVPVPAGSVEALTGSTGLTRIRVRYELRRLGASGRPTWSRSGLRSGGDVKRDGCPPGRLACPSASERTHRGAVHDMVRRVSRPGIAQGRGRSSNLRSG